MQTHARLIPAYVDVEAIAMGKNHVAALRKIGFDIKGFEVTRETHDMDENRGLCVAYDSLFLEGEARHFKNEGSST